MVAAGLKRFQMVSDGFRWLEKRLRCRLAGGGSPEYPYPRRQLPPLPTVRPRQMQKGRKSSNGSVSSSPRDYSNRRLRPPSHRGEDGDASRSAKGLCVASGAGCVASGAGSAANNQGCAWRASFAFRSVELGSGSTGGAARASPSDRACAPERRQPPPRVSSAGYGGARFVVSSLIK